MTELATLIEKRRIALNRLNEKTIPRRKTEREDLQEYIKALDKAIDKLQEERGG